MTENQGEKWPKVAIIVLNWNGWRDTIECLESLGAHIKTRNLSFIFITIALVIFAGFREIGVDRDSLAYANIIQTIDFSAGFLNLNFSDKEPTFYAIVYIAQWLFGDPIRGTFIIYAILGVTLKMIGIYRLSHIPLLSVLFYICSYYILHELTQIRAGVAAALFLLALPDIVNKNFFNYIFKICIATLFHYSAIILVFAYFINTNKKEQLFYLFVPWMAIILYFIDFGTHILYFLVQITPQIMSSRIQLYLELLMQGVFSEINVINLFYTSLLFMYYFLILNIKIVKEPLDVLQIKLLGWMLFLFYSFASVPVFAFRLSELIGVVLIGILPFFVTIIKQKRIAYVFVIIYSLMIGINFIFVQNLIKMPLLILYLYKLKIYV